MPCRATANRAAESFTETAVSYPALLARLHIARGHAHMPVTQGLLRLQRRPEFGAAASACRQRSHIDQRAFAGGPRGKVLSSGGVYQVSDPRPLRLQACGVE